MVHVRISHAAASGPLKPVLVLQHLNQDGPAHLAAWLKRQRRSFEVFNTEAGQAFPEDIAPYGALALLGGEMGANDNLPSLRQAERLILQAMQARLPVLGLCLGAQLMARALGARVRNSPAPEVGWQRLKLRTVPEAEQWFGAQPGGETIIFHWHYDSFELPPGATWLAQTEACPQQAFCIGPHLGVQFHPELDDAKLRAWVEAHDSRFDALPRIASVQSGDDMLRDAAARLPAQQRLANHLFERWLSTAR